MASKGLLPRSDEDVPLDAAVLDSARSAESELSTGSLTGVRRAVASPQQAAGLVLGVRAPRSRPLQPHAAATAMAARARPHSQACRAWW